MLYVDKHKKKNQFSLFLPLSLSISISVSVYLPPFLRPSQEAFCDSVTGHPLDSTTKHRKQWTSIFSLLPRKVHNTGTISYAWMRS